MTASFAYSDDDPRYRRPPGGRRADAWYSEQVRPCGDRDVLRWHYWHAYGDAGGPPDLRDCRTVRIKPWLLAIWEPLITKAPGPHLAHAYCCYIKTVIFYHEPHIVRPWSKLYQGANGKWHSSSPGSFEEWDQIESRMTWDDQVVFNGEVFEVLGGRVMWTHAPGQPRRWWMRHGARRKQADRR